MHFDVSWRHCGRVHLYLTVLAWRGCVFHSCVLELTYYYIYEVLFKVFLYANMLTTHGLENSLAWHWPGPEEVGFRACEVYRSKIQHHCSNIIALSYVCVLCVLH
jgi:hypothetical protein